MIIFDILEILESSLRDVDFTYDIFHFADHNIFCKSPHPSLEINFKTFKPAEFSKGVKDESDTNQNFFVHWKAV